jgi:L-lactate dehydrogenase complex protein LldG
MNSREEILAAVKKNKPEFTPAPHIEDFAKHTPKTDLVSYFSEILKKVGGEAIVVENKEKLQAMIAEVVKEYKNVVSLAADFPYQTINLADYSDPHQLKNLDLAIIEGQIAVAENAAVWITASQMGYRAIPFITQYLVLIIRKETIVWNMHQAYSSIDVKQDGYGVFVAGPSKTADIEQSLVVGAHGPRSLRVFIY